MYPLLKRALDIIGAGLGLLLLWPLFFLIILALFLSGSGRIFFYQMRVGRFGRPFTIVKFCTLRPSAPAAVSAAELERRGDFATPLGEFLRRTSLDELPQLWNILVGDMSFVGPRPVVYAEQNLLFARAELHADTCRPGLTGLSQVRGRGALGWQEKARCDAYYCRRMSLSLDIYILLQTLRCFIQSAPQKTLDKPA